MKVRNAKKGSTSDVLIYDAACPVCSSMVKWIQDNAIAGSFELVPCQAVPASSPYLVIKGEDCLQAMHVVLPDGTILAGERALPEIATRLRKYRFAGVLFKLPGALTLSRIVYRWFAGRRYRIAAMLFHRGMNESGRRRDCKMEKSHESERKKRNI